MGNTSNGHGVEARFLLRPNGDVPVTRDRTLLFRALD